MSRDASITFEWGDGETTFRLDIKHLEKLQEARDCGPMVLLERLSSGRWMVQDIREVLRWGLIGGGKTPAEASKLLRLYFEETFPGVDNLLAAIRILGHAVVGPPDEPLGEPEAPNPAESELTISPTES